MAPGTSRVHLRLQRGRRQLGVVLRQCCTPTLDSRGVPVDYRPGPDICP